MSSSESTDLAILLRDLHLSHQRQLDDLLTSHRRETATLFRNHSSLPPSSPTSRTAIVVPVASGSPPRTPVAIAVSSPVSASTHLSHNNTPLSLGASVTLRTRGRSGRIGDSATVIDLSCTSDFVQLELTLSGSRTQRLARNLTYTTP